jgi:hypothetical protein
VSHPAARGWLVTNHSLTAPFLHDSTRAVLSGERLADALRVLIAVLSQACDICQVCKISRLPSVTGAQG